jgi:Fic family protein
MDSKNFICKASGQVIRIPSGYYAFIPSTLPPDLHWLPALISLLGEADRALARLAEVGNQFPALHALVQPYIRQEAVLSSRIEGTRTTLEQLYTYEAVQQSFFADTHEVQNYVIALDYGLQRLSSLPVSLRLVRELHSRLMKGVRGEHSTPGEFRHSQNWIGPEGCTLVNATYVPPPLEEMKTALSAWEDFVHLPSDLPPLARLAMIHYQFEAIHPFVDGNGRIGRLLIVLLMCEWGLLPLPLLYLSAYFESMRSEYYARLLAVSQKGEWEEWLRFFFTGVRDQAQVSAQRIGRLRVLISKYGAILEKEHAGERLKHVVNILYGRPIITIRQLQLELKLGDYKTAERCVNRLVELGILREVTGRRRNRIFRADAIWQAIESIP